MGGGEKGHACKYTIAYTKLPFIVAHFTFQDLTASCKKMCQSVLCSHRKWSVTLVLKTGMIFTIHSLTREII